MYTDDYLKFCLENTSTNLKVKTIVPIPDSAVFEKQNFTCLTSGTDYDRASIIYLTLSTNYSLYSVHHA